MVNVARIFRNAREVLPQLPVDDVKRAAWLATAALELLADDTADLTITYGSSVETYRRVPIDKVISTLNGNSRLVRVAGLGTAPTAYTALPSSTPITYPADPSAGSQAIDLSMFAGVFAVSRLKPHPIVHATPIVLRNLCGI